MRSQRRGLLLVAAASLCLTACPNPNLYQTARTTPKGKLGFTVAAEALGFQADTEVVDDNGNYSTEEATHNVPLPPTFQLRYGLSDEVDMGFHVYNFVSPGFDVKYNFMKDAVDLAIDPGAQVFTGSTGDENFWVVYGHLPLILDLNFSSSISMVLAPGITYARSSIKNGSDTIFTDLNSNSGFIARAGIGLDFRISDGFALHPEVTFLRALNDTNWTTYVAGLGFNFGKLPSFHDLDE
ncbi:MAG: hypothetical protein R3B07_12040 [Polyangiaceae bacterium]